MTDEDIKTGKKLVSKVVVLAVGSMAQGLFELAVGGDCQDRAACLKFQGQLRRMGAWVYFLYKQHG
jgi:hypothetical protein